MKNIFTLITLTFLSIVTIHAQDSNTKKADKQFSKLQFVKASESYEKLINKGQSSDYIINQLAECYYNISNNLEAEKWYSKLANKTKNINVIFKYSQVLKANGKYEESNIWMKKFVDLKPNDNRSKKFIKDQGYLPKIISKGKRFILKNLEINSEYSDFGGILNNNKLYITSSRNKVGLVDRLINLRNNYGWNNEPYLDIYSYDVSNDGSFSNESNLDSNINTKYHEGLVSFDSKGNMYITRESFYEKQSIKDSESNTMTSLIGIYKINEGDKNVVALNINSNKYSVKNPSVTSNGKVLYFSSDMPGGFGNFDIYRGDIDKKGNIINVENLGPKINTEGQEMFPFISKKNELYFSSDSQLGLGGLDVFFSREIVGEWSKLRNLGLPVNSNADDFAFYINDDNGEGFVSSNRSGGKGSDDIYSVKILKPICDVILTANIIDSKTKLRIDLASTSISDNDGNIKITKTTSSDGLSEFILTCDQVGKIIVSKNGYNSKTVDLNVSSEEITSIDILLNPMEKIIIAEKIRLNSIYFDFDKSDVRDEAAFELDKLVEVMNKYPKMTIRIESHTDNKGSEIYNKKLSELRAKAMFNYVVSKGVNSSRLSYVGNGESSPVVNCTNCSDEDDQLNRRSEFIITGGNPGN